MIEFDQIKMEPPVLRIRSDDEVAKLDTKYIRCKILYEPVEPKSADFNAPKSADPKTLIINVHGGGFCLGTCETNDVYLRYWARKTPGVGILSIDISLAPEHKFPVAIQEIVDVYLTLTTKDDASDILGFKPRQIFLSGDSSGAYQAMAALVVLNEINKSSSGLIKMMPSAIIALYPSYSCAASMKPSYMMCVYSQILNPLVMALFGDSYLPGEEEEYNKMAQLTDANRNESEKSGDGPQDFYLGSYMKYFGRKGLAIGKNIGGKILKTVSYIASTDGLNEPKVYSSPQFAKTKDQVYERVKARSMLTSHPFLSPSFYDDFDSLSNVTLYQVCCQPDPVVDHSIIMGRKWKGKLIVDVFNNMQHGFMNAMGLSIVKEAADVVLNRIQELCYE